MTRREFTAVAGLALLPSRSAKSAATFSVRFARTNPFDTALQFTEPGSDEFKGEKLALELEKRLGRIFDGKEPAPDALQPWVARRDHITAARFYALPDSLVRYEIRISGPNGIEYHTGLWRTPDFSSVHSNSVTSGRPWFRDVTGHVLGAASSFREQLLNGNPYWRGRMDSATGIDVYGNQGLAVAISTTTVLTRFTSASRADCRTGFTKSGATEVRKTSPSMPAWRFSMIRPRLVCRFPELRSAGSDCSSRVRPDAVFESGRRPVCRTEGRVPVRDRPAGRVYRDGCGGLRSRRSPRLYLCCYVYFQSEDQYQFPAPITMRATVRRTSCSAIVRSTKVDFRRCHCSTGINQNNDRFSFAPAWCDFNGDGWPDLYVANDFGRNNLYGTGAASSR